MTYHAGVDVSLEETAICIVDEAGAIMKEMRACSEPKALADALTAVGLPLQRVGLEACSFTAWPHDGLRAAGWSALCIETHQANTAMKTMPSKTGRNDARADHAHGLVPSGPHEVTPVPVVAVAARGAPHGTQ